MKLSDLLQTQRNTRISKTCYLLILLVLILPLLLLLGAPNFSIYQQVQDVSNVHSKLSEINLPSQELASALNLSHCSPDFLNSTSENLGEVKRALSGLAIFKSRLLKNYDKDNFTKLVSEVLNVEPQLSSKSCLPPLVIGGANDSLESGVRILLDHQIVTCGSTPQVNPNHQDRAYSISNSINSYLAFLSEYNVIKKIDKKLRTLENKLLKLRNVAEKDNIRLLKREILITKLSREYALFYSQYGQLLSLAYEAICEEVQGQSTPEVPTNINLSNKLREISWNGSADGYQVYLSKDSGDTYQIFAETNANKISLNSLLNNVDYFIKVVALQNLNSIKLVSDYSKEIKIRLIASLPSVEPMLPSPTPSGTMDPTPSSTPNAPINTKPNQISAPLIEYPVFDNVDAVNDLVEVKWSRVDEAIGYLLRVDQIVNGVRTRIYNTDNHSGNTYQLSVVAGNTYDVWVHSKRYDFNYNNLDSYSLATHRIFYS